MKIKNPIKAIKAKNAARKEEKQRKETERAIAAAKAKAEHEAFLNSMSPEERKIYFLEKELKKEKARADRAQRRNATFYDYMIASELASAAVSIAHNNRSSKSNSGRTSFKSDGSMR